MKYVSLIVYVALFLMYSGLLNVHSETSKDTYVTTAIDHDSILISAMERDRGSNQPEMLKLALKQYLLAINEEGIKEKDNKILMDFVNHLIGYEGIELRNECFLIIDAFLKKQAASISIDENFKNYFNEMKQYSKNLIVSDVEMQTVQKRREFEKTCLDYVKYLLDNKDQSRGFFENQDLINKILNFNFTELNYRARIMRVVAKIHNGDVESNEFKEILDTVSDHDEIVKNKVDFSYLIKNLNVFNDANGGEEKGEADSAHKIVLDFLTKNSDYAENENCVEIFLKKMQ